jgi:fatty-acyl-CoA synthase
MDSIYEQNLDKTPANFAALSPVSFLERSADIYPDLDAVVHGNRRYPWAQVRER